MSAKATIADDMSIIGDPCIREAEVWKMLRRLGIVSTPAYRLGRSRLSCIACIFGNPDQWASMRHLAPDWFERIDTYEDGFGRSIQRRHGIGVPADRSRPRQALVDPRARPPCARARLG